MNELEIVRDPLENIKFWFELLNNEKLSHENIRMVNEALYNELQIYLNPLIIKR